MKKILKFVYRVRVTSLICSNIYLSVTFMYKNIIQKNILNKL